MPQQHGQHTGGGPGKGSSSRAHTRSSAADAQHRATRRGSPPVSSSHEPQPGDRRRDGVEGHRRRTHSRSRPQRSDPPTQGELADGRAEEMELTQSGQALLWGGKRSSRTTPKPCSTRPPRPNPSAWRTWGVTQTSRRSGGRRGGPGGAVPTQGTARPEPRARVQPLTPPEAELKGGATESREPRRRFTSPSSLDQDD